MLATLIIALTAICFGMVPLFARALLEIGLSPEAVALYRFCLALPLAVLFVPRRCAARRPFVALTGAGLASGVGWTAYLNALDQVPVASAGVVYMSYPLFVVFLARLLVGQPLTMRALMGASLIAGGALIANGAGTVTGAQWLALLSSLPAPVGFALLVVVLSAVGRDLSTLERWSAIAIGHVAGLLPAALLADSGDLVPASATGWAWIIGIALVTATVPQILYTFAARAVSPGRAAAAGATELPTMMAIGWLAFGEHVDLHEGIGALLVMAAVAVTPAVMTTRRESGDLLLGAAAAGSVDNSVMDDRQ